MIGLKKFIFLLFFSFLILSEGIAQSSVSFKSSGLNGVTLESPTSLQFGPDNRLYVSQQDGTIFAYTINRKGPNDYEVSATETILLIKNIPNHNDDGSLNTTVKKRQITGILVKGTATNPILYVTSSDPRIGGGGTGGDLNLDTNSGVISKLTWNGSSWTKMDLVLGLPRSEENHSVNGMQLDEINNILYLAVGGSTNAGAPSNNFAFLTEYALAAAILKIDLTAIQNNFGGTYNLPTLDDPTRANTGPNGSDVGDPFGGNDGLNQAKLVIGGPVQIHSPGYRNSYDLVITKAPGKEGRMYTVDNGANGGWGGHPDQEGAFGNPLSTNVTNNYVVGEPGSTGPGPNDAKVNNKDNLHLVSKPGMSPIYGGHPTPIRANPSGAGLYWYDNTTNTPNFSLNPTVDWPPVPLSLANPVEGDFRNGGVDDGALYTWSASTNGLAEYTSSKFFNGAMVGDLLAASFDGSIYRIKLNADGTATEFGESLASGFGSIPLDVTAQGTNEIFEGTIWAATYGSDAITIFEPEGGWEPVNSVDASNPIARHENGFVELNGKFYLIGGRESTTINIFDPAQKTWTTGSNLPFKMHHVQPVTWQNKIYLMGAYQGNYSNGNVNNSESPVPNIYIYDPATNAWTQGPAIPRPRGSAGVVVYKDEFYLIAGIVNGHENGWVNWVDKYNPTTNTWTQLAAVPRLRDHFHATLLNDKIYLAGGRQTKALGDVFGETIAEVDVYDLLGNTWSTLPASANLITERAGAAAVVLEGEIYLIGGESQSQKISHKESEILDPLTQTWRTGASLLVGRHGTGALVYNNSIYIAAGSGNRGGGPVLASMEAFSTTSNCSGDVNNFSLDDDGDGYSNGDETLNGTNPCSASSIPNDFDKDFLSDLLDTDDDNDTILDTQDLFALDASNGMNTTIPIAYPFLNGDPGFGLFGLGFTGLMTNKSEDYLDLFDSQDPDLIMGGAVGIASVPANSGDAKTDDQEYAFQFGFKVNPSIGIFTVKSKLQGTPFFDGIPLNQLKDQTQGIYIGTGDQDTYFKFALTANFGNPGLMVYGEAGGTEFANQVFPINNILSTGILYLYIEVDPVNSQIKLYYQTGSDPDKISVGSTITLPVIFNNLLNGNAAMATGIIASAGSASTTFSASWDFLNILTTAPYVKEDAPDYYTKFSGNPTSSFNIDLKEIFVHNDISELTYEVVSVEANDFINSSVINNGILTINFIGSETGSAKVIVKATDLKSLSAEYDFLMQVIPEPTPFIRINAAGSDYLTWSADKFFSGGSTFSKIIPINNTTDDVIYHSERNSSTSFTYQIPVDKPGYYRANLHFAEIFHGISNTKGIGARVFEVQAEGIAVLNNYDIFKEAGGPANAIIEKIDSVLVTDGSLSLRFIAKVDRAKVSAIELATYSVELPPNSPPIIENPGTRFVYEGGFLSIPIVASDLNFGDVLTYQASGLPALLSIDQSTGVISGTIEANQSIFPVLVTVSDNKGGVSQVNFDIHVVEPANYSFRINAGGSAVLYGTEQWEGDQFYGDSKTYSTAVEISNTSKDEVYQSERSATKLNYEIPMPGAGFFKITLHFAEIFWVEPGKRVFSVDIESGKAGLIDYDIFQEAGGANRAISESFIVEVTDGALSLELIASINQAKISGIEISSCASPQINSMTASASEICVGASSTITVNGTLGGATEWKLYTSSCGGTLVDSNTTGVFQVSPTLTTTYFVRGEGGCTQPSTCLSLEIKVGVPPNVTISPAGPFCTGNAAVNLTAASAGGTWSGPGITNATLGTFNPTTAGAGSHTIKYKISGVCVAEDSEIIQVKSVNTQVSISGSTLTAAADGAIYQWINCADNSNISGANAKTFTPTQSGSYAVRVTENGCTGLSSCLGFAIVGVNEPFSDFVSVYPNPASEKFVIEFPATTSKVSFDLTDMTGRSAWKDSYEFVKTVEVDTREFNPGMYLLGIKSIDRKITVKVIIR